MKARWFKGYETEVGKALAGGSSTYNRPVVNYMKKHKVTLHTKYKYKIPYLAISDHTIIIR